MGKDAFGNPCHVLEVWTRSGKLLKAATNLTTSSAAAGVAQEIQDAIIAQSR